MSNPTKDVFTIMIGLNISGVLTGRLMFHFTFSSYMALFIIRYGEIGLKSKSVRRRFEASLRGNITTRFVKLGKECRISSDRGRIYLWSDDVQCVKNVLRRTFGIVSFSQVEECTSEKEDIFRLAIEVASPLFKKDMSFRIKARRTGQHVYTSVELARDAGSAVYLANEHLNPRVDLRNPELTIYIEVRQNRAFVFSGIISGPGGMPVGTQGKVLGLISNERDVAASWLMMKRGCRVFLSAENEEIASVLEPWDPKFKIVELVDISGAESMARHLKAEGIALGWNVQEFDNDHDRMSGMTLPVFYPLIGMEPTQVDELLSFIRS